MNRPLAVWPSCFTILPVPSVVSAHGGPLWGEQARSLNLYDETGVEHEKNVGCPRAAAVAAGGDTKLGYLNMVRSSLTFVRKQIGLTVISDSDPLVHD
jgi:hypothetical protein